LHEPETRLPATPVLATGVRSTARGGLVSSLLLVGCSRTCDSEFKKARQGAGLLLLPRMALAGAPVHWASRPLRREFAAHFRSGAWPLTVALALAPPTLSVRLGAG
jgi:hypothetical protein